MSDLEKIFFQENFSINKFLSKSTQKSDLETLRTQLKEYGASLHNSMTEIFKTETESIVDLAENLTNLDSKIQNLIQPASQLREEILTLYNTIKFNRESYYICLNNLRENQRNGRVLSLKQNIVEAKKNIEVILDGTTDETPINLLNFERVANNYALQLCFANQLITDDEKMNRVDVNFASFINSKLQSALDHKRDEIVIQCLRYIVNIRQEREAEKMYREQFLASKLQCIFGLYNLKAQGNILQKVYDDALRVLDEDMSYIMNIVNADSGFRSYRFVRNAFWAEMDQLLPHLLDHVASPGNPELFQRRFCETWRFLETVVNRCELLESFEVCANKTQDLNARIVVHVQSFNLPVYFEIRYQQISSAFETAFVQTLKPGANIYSVNPAHANKLHITGIFLECVRLSFAADTYISHLSGQFIKLSLLLMTRFLSWFPTYTQQFKAAGSGVNIMDLAYILNDLLVVQNFIGNADSNLNVYAVCKKDLGDVLAELSRANYETIDETFQATIKFIVDLKTEEVVTCLQNVNAIPRLYRKTNRSTPTSSSNYIIDAIYVVDILQVNFNPMLKPPPKSITDEIISNVAKKFVLLVSDVLNSVSKTEQSLKRLKRQTGNPSSNSMQTVDATSDNYKIREQIRLDVGHFVEKFMPISFDPTKAELARLATSAGYVLREG